MENRRSARSFSLSSAIWLPATTVWIDIICQKCCRSNSWPSSQAVTAGSTERARALRIAREEYLSPFTAITNLQPALLLLFVVIDAVNADNRELLCAISASND